VQAIPDVLLPAITCPAEFVPYFLNLLRDWTAAVWSASTPLKTQTPVRVRNQKHSSQHSFSSNATTPSSVSQGDQRIKPFTPNSNPRFGSRHTSAVKLQTPVRQNHLTQLSFCSNATTPGCVPDQMRSVTPDSNAWLENSFISGQKFSSAKNRYISPQITDAPCVNINEHHVRITKPDGARHRPLQQHNTILHTEHFTPSIKERHGRALFNDASAVKNSGKRKQFAGNKSEKTEKTPIVPSFNLDSNVDFPDMKSSQRYCFSVLFYMFSNILLPVEF